MRTRAIATAVVLTGLSMGIAQAQTTTDTSTTSPPARTTPGVVVVAPGATAAQIGALTAAQTATNPNGNAPTQANASTTPGARAAANDSKMQAASVASSTPGTAFDQGYADPNAAAQAARAVADFQEFSSARQRGIQVPAPLPTDTVAAHPELRGWLANWKDVLADVGVGDRRANFEAARLNQDEFAHWASRLVRAYDPSINEIAARPVVQAMPVADDTSDDSN